MIDQPPAIVFEVPRPVIDYERLVRAIEERENGRWSSPGGRACWTIAAWREETSLPFRLAQNRAQSRILMVQRLAKFAARFTRDDIEPTVWRLSTAWYRGYDGSKRATRYPNDYGECCEGIYQSLMPRGG